MAFAFAYSALPSGPPLMATNPLRPRAFRAAAVALAQGLARPRADLFLATTFPYLFFVRSFACKPPIVFSLRPLSTLALAPLPLAILDTRLAFITAFMPFIAAFIAAFMGFIGNAMARSKQKAGKG